MINTRIAIVTSSRNPHITESSKFLLDSFKKAGYDVGVAPWDGRVRWSDYSTLLLLECWNYHLHKDAFIHWIGEREQAGQRVWNPPDIIRWNTNKIYLLDLQSRGVPILETEIIGPATEKTILSIMESRNWAEAIIKPVVGASSYGTQKVTRTEANRVQNKLGKETQWLIQEFYADISKGEYSFVFFNRTFSHAILKVPKANDYRVHIDFGGKEILVEPDMHLVTQASDILRTVPGDLLYTRIDAVETAGRLQLMELELTEPYLFFDSAPSAVERFVQAFETLSTKQ